MKAKLGISLGLLAVLAASAAALSSADTSTSQRRGDQVIAKDTATQYPEYAVARAMVSGPSQNVYFKVTTRPKKLPVQLNAIVRCQKGFLFDYWPGPGEDAGATSKKSPITGHYTTPLADPDFCDYQASGQIGGGKSDLRAKITVKILQRG